MQHSSIERLEHVGGQTIFEKVLLKDGWHCDLGIKAFKLLWSASISSNVRNTDDKSFRQNKLLSAAATWKVGNMLPIAN